MSKQEKLDYERHFGYKGGEFERQLDQANRKDLDIIEDAIAQRRGGLPKDSNVEFLESAIAGIHQRARDNIAAVEEGEKHKQIGYDSQRKQWTLAKQDEEPTMIRLMKEYEQQQNFDKPKQKEEEEEEDDPSKKLISEEHYSLGQLFKDPVAKLIYNQLRAKLVPANEDTAVQNMIMMAEIAKYNEFVTAFHVYKDEMLEKYSADTILKTGEALGNIGRLYDKYGRFSTRKHKENIIYAIHLISQIYLDKYGKEDTAKRLQSARNVPEDIATRPITGEEALSFPPSTGQILPRF